MKRPLLALLLPFALMSGAFGLAISAHELPATPALSHQQTERALRDAAEGDAFSLATLLPRIEDPGLASLAQARLAATQLNAAEAQRLVTDYLAGGTRSPASRAMAWRIVADARFANGDYREAADATHAWDQALTEQGAQATEHADALQMAMTADRLATAPKQMTDTYAPKPENVTRDKVGLLRSNMLINGKPQEVVLDTGANLSTVSLSTAQKLGLRMLDGEASVGSGSRQAVTSRVGMADHLEFAGLSLSHVAFLVLDDDQLKIPVPGGYQIDAIIGFPVMRQLQRLEFTNDGKLLPSRSDASAMATGNLRMAGSDLYVKVMLNGMPVAMQLDSGCARSVLSSRFASGHPSVVKGLKAKQERVAGAGGTQVNESAAWPDVQVRIGDQHIVMPAITITLGSAGNGKDANLLGSDILRSFDHWTIDFQRMQFEVGSPLTEATGKPRAD